MLTVSCSHEDQLGWGSTALQEDVGSVEDPEKKTERDMQMQAKIPCTLFYLFVFWLCDIMLLELLASVALEDKTV